MITLYAGEMFITPVPLHLSLNYCSHKCAMCFANLNNPERKADIKKLQSQLKNFHKQNNLTAHLMRNGYPVLISNTVDPFAQSNYQLSQPIISQLTDLNIPVAIQTRGASTQRADDAMEWVIKNTKPSVWYVSITTTDEDVRKRLEPGAPSIKHRLDLIDRLISAGHKVIGAVNPYKKEWIPDVKGLYDELYKKGVRHSWIGILHFNSNQLRVMPERDKAALGELAAVKKKKEVNAEFIEVKNLVNDIKQKHTDFEIFLGLDGKENYFFDIYHETYNHKTFPVFGDFYNYVSKNKKAGDKITFEDLMHVFEPKLPIIEHNFSGIAYSAKRSDYDKPEVQAQINSLKKCHASKYLQMVWNDPVFKFSPSIHDGYAKLVKRVGEDIELDLDKYGNVQLVYDPIDNHNNEEYVFFNH